MSTADRVRLDTNIRFRRVADEGVVVDQRSAEIMVLSELAIRTLELIRETESRDQVIHFISKEYDASEEQVRSDFLTFLDELSSRGMLLTESSDVR